MKKEQLLRNLKYCEDQAKSIREGVEIRHHASTIALIGGLSTILRNMADELQAEYDKAKQDSRPI